MVARARPAQLRGRVISTIRPIDLRFVDELVDFIRGKGYVLDFSDTSFSEFFEQELNVDIDDPAYARNGGSKGKRLRCFLETVDNATAVRTLTALWEYRVEILASTQLVDSVQNAEGRLLSIIERLSGSAAASLDPPPAPAVNRAEVAALRDQLNAMHQLAPQQRGYALEGFLKQAFDLFGLAMRAPFRNTGEQIDGSFVLANEIYLVEAKWHKEPTGVGDLFAFHGKLDKAAWTRGLFVSFNGFTMEGLTAFGTAKRMICMAGRDIYDALDREIPLPAVLERKVRGAAETGRPFIPVSELFPK